MYILSIRKWFFFQGKNFVWQQSLGTLLPAESCHHRCTFVPRCIDQFLFWNWSFSSTSGSRAGWAGPWWRVEGRLYSVLARSQLFLPQQWNSPISHSAIACRHSSFVGIVRSVALKVYFNIWERLKAKLGQWKDLVFPEIPVTSVTFLPLLLRPK